MGLGKEDVKVITFRNKVDGEWINIKYNEEADFFNRVIFDECPKCGKLAEMDLEAFGSNEGAIIGRACGHRTICNKDGSEETV